MAFELIGETKRKIFELDVCAVYYVQWRLEKELSLEASRQVILSAAER